MESLASGPAAVPGVCVMSFRAVMGGSGQQHPSAQLGRLCRSIASRVCGYTGEVLRSNACGTIRSAEEARNLRVRLAAPLARLHEVRGATVADLVRMARGCAAAAAIEDAAGDGGDGDGKHTRPVPPALPVAVWEAPTGWWEETKRIADRRSRAGSTGSSGSASSASSAGKGCSSLDTEAAPESESAGGASDESTTVTLVHVEAPNRPSLLLDISRTLSDYGADIVRALVSTRENLAVDTFEIADRDTRGPLDAARCSSLAEALEACAAGGAVGVEGASENAKGQATGQQSTPTRLGPNNSLKLLGRMLRSPSASSISESVDSDAGEAKRCRCGSGASDELPSSPSDSENGNNKAMPRARFRCGSFERSGSLEGSVRLADGVDGGEDEPPSGMSTPSVRKSMLPRVAVRGYRARARSRGAGAAVADADGGEPPPASVRRLLGDAVSRLLATLGVVLSRAAPPAAERLKSQLVDAMRLRIFAPDTPILTRGDELSEWTVLAEGEVSVLFGSSTLTPVLLGPGDAFGDLALLHVHAATGPVLALGTKPGRGSGKQLAKIASGLLSRSVSADFEEVADTVHSAIDSADIKLTCTASSVTSAGDGTGLTSGDGMLPVVAYALTQRAYQRALGEFYAALDEEVADALKRVEGLGAAVSPEKLATLVSSLRGERIITVEGRRALIECNPTVAYVVVRGALESAGAEEGALQFSVGAILGVTAMGVEALLGESVNKGHALNLVSAPQGCRLVPLRAEMVTSIIGPARGKWREALLARLGELRAMEERAAVREGQVATPTARAIAPTEADAEQQQQRPRGSIFAMLCACGSDDNAYRSCSLPSSFTSSSARSSGSLNRYGRFSLSSIAQRLSSSFTRSAKHLSLDSFELKGHIGKGMTGRVYLARHKPSSSLCALKVIIKSRMLQLEEVEHVLAEGQVLSELSSPFCVLLLGSFQDAHALYLAFEYAPGGDMWHHVHRRRRSGKGPLSERTARYYIASTVLAIEAVHSMGFVYRDLKPENLLLDAKGRLKLADMGFCSRLAPGARAPTICGTPDYISPELISSRGCTRAADLWSLGVLLYELLSGKAPFKSPTTLMTYTKIAEVGRHGSYGGKWSHTIGERARGLISSFLRADENTRLGMGPGGFGDIKAHPFFEGFDWMALAEGHLSPPLTPDVAHPSAMQASSSKEGYHWKVGADELSPEQDARFAPFVAMNRFHLT